LVFLSADAVKELVPQTEEEKRVYNEAGEYW
jgi:hypothetical protein